MNTGIVGIGLMGRAFVERFQSQGHTVRVFNRTRDAVKDLEESGVDVCDSVEELISASDTVILMVSNADAIRGVLSLDQPDEQAPGLRVYVANVATQLGETEGYTLSEHVAALAAHDVGHLIDVVLANDDTTARVPSGYPAEPVRIDLPQTDARPRLELAAVVDPANAHRHDPQRLTRALVRLLDEQPNERPVAPVRSPDEVVADPVAEKMMRFLFEIADELVERDEAAHPTSDEG